MAHTAHRLGAAGPADFWDGFDARPRAEQALLGNREWFGRLCTAAMRPAMEAAFDDFAPELVLRDPCDFASAIAAEARGSRTRRSRARAATSSGRSLDLIAPGAAGRDRGGAARRAVPDALPAVARPPVLPGHAPLPRGRAARAGGRDDLRHVRQRRGGRVGADPYRALLAAVEGLDRPSC